MARCRVFGHRNIDRKYLYDKESDDNDTVKSINEKLNSILQRVDEIEIFKDATKEYVKVSRTVIANLRQCSLLLGNEVKAAEEAILESERTIASLQSEIDSCFLPIRIQDHQSIGARKKTSNGRWGRWCRNAANKFNRNASKKCISAIENQNLSWMNSVENERANSENCAGVIFHKSETRSEVSNPDYRPINVKSLKNRFKGSVTDSDFRNVSRMNCREEMRIKPSSEIGNLPLQKINRYDTSSDNADYEAYNEYSVNESNYSSHQKEKCSQILQRTVDKYKLCGSEIDDLSSRKAYRNLDINSSLCSDDDTDICSTEVVVDSSETDEEFSKNSGSLLSLNQTENSVKEFHKNFKPESPLQNCSNLVQSRNTSVPYNQRRDSKLVRAELNQLPEGSSDNYSDRHILLSDKEFSEFNDIRTSLHQKRNLNKKSNDNSFDAVESLRELSLQSESSKQFSKQSNENYNKRIASEDKMVISNHLSSKNFQTLCEIDQCSEGTATFDSSSNVNWNGETVIIYSTNPCFKEINEESKFNERMGQSLNEVSPITENEENSNYISINSSCFNNKAVCFSRLRETLTKHFAGENVYNFDSNSSLCNYLNTSLEDTTDTSVYNYSSDAQQGDKLSSSARKSSDISIGNESSDVHQMKSSSGISFTETSSNISMHDNSNSFQFRSDSPENESSSSNVYASSFSMSKELSSLPETDLSYAAFKEDLPTESLDSPSNAQPSYNTSLKVNISQGPKNRNLTSEFSEVLTKDVSGYPPDCKASNRSNEVDVLAYVSNETPHDTTKQFSSETENNLQKSRSFKMLENAATNEKTITNYNERLQLKSENSWTSETGMMQCAFRRAEFNGKVKNVSDHIYSKRIRDFINNYHSIL